MNIREEGHVLRKEEDADLKIDRKKERKKERRKGNVEDNYIQNYPDDTRRPPVGQVWEEGNIFTQLPSRLSLYFEIFVITFRHTTHSDYCHAYSCLMMFFFRNGTLLPVSRARSNVRSPNSVIFVRCMFPTKSMHHIRQGLRCNIIE